MPKKPATTKEAMVEGAFQLIRESGNRRTQPRRELLRCGIFVPFFRFRRHIGTITYTAGYNLHGFPGYRADHEPLSLEDVLNGKGVTPKLRRIRPYGKRHMYSGGGITLAQLAFERITGTTLREAFRKEVAEPLGLKRTGFFRPLDEESVTNAAFGGRLAEKEDPTHGYHYYPEHAAAGLWTTPTELVKIGLELSKSYRKGGLLKKKTARRMMTPVMDDYGLCLDVWEYETGRKGYDRFLPACFIQLTL